MLSNDHYSQAPARRAPDRLTAALKHAVKIEGAENLVAEVVEITPAIASRWLQANRKNRPVRRKHVGFLAGEITGGNWEVNGQAIIIAENEDILDGQHRLLAVIEAGQAIRTLVIYGVEPEAFATIDTGAVRSGADALFLHYNDMPAYTVKAAAVAAQWCHRLERGNLQSQDRLSNTDVIEYVRKHQSILRCAETLQAYPKEARPLSIGMGAALYEIFSRKHEQCADQFMKALYTGENVSRSDPEYLLRQAFTRDMSRTSKLPAVAKMRMCIKGWNHRRRGLPAATQRSIALRTDDDPRVRIY